MRQVKLLVLMCAVLIAGMAFTGFECSSTELTSAKLYIQQKNYVKALEALQKEVEKNPKSDEGYYLMGLVQGEKEQLPEMVSSFDKSLAISKKFEKQISDQRKVYWANYFNKGVAYYSKAANSATPADTAKILFEKSISAFNTATVLQPDSADTYKNLAYVYLSSQRYDDAIKPFEKLITLKKVVEGYRFLGEIYYNKGAKGMSEYLTSKKVEDSVAAMEEYNKAIKVLEEGRKYFPNDEGILSELSNAYINTNRLSIAADAFKAGIAANPKNKSYRYNYGVVLLQASKFEEAVEQFKKAIEIDPEYQNAIYNLAVSYVKWGSSISKEIDDKKLDPNSAEFKEKTAQVKEKLNAAIPHMEQVIKIKADDANMWELLGKIYANVGMTDKAENAYKTADKLRK